MLHLNLQTILSLAFVSEARKSVTRKIGAKLVEADGDFPIVIIVITYTEIVPAAVFKR